MKVKNLVLAAILFSSSCAMISGNKNDSISISSQPSGAEIIINGMNYGKTPATINIEAKNQKAVLIKEGYGSSELSLETIVSMKNGACAADALTSMLIVPLYSLLFSGNCSEFKQKEHFVNISPSQNANFGRTSNSRSGFGNKGLGSYYDQQNDGFKAGYNQQYQDGGYNRRR